MPGSTPSTLRNRYMNRPPDGALTLGGVTVNLIVDGVQLHIEPSSTNHYGEQLFSTRMLAPSWSPGDEQRTADRPASRQWMDYDTGYDGWLELYFANGSLRLPDNVVLDADGSLPADAVWHERRHGNGSRPGNVYAWIGGEWVTLHALPQPAVEYLGNVRPDGVLPGTDLMYCRRGVRSLDVFHDGQWRETRTTRMLGISRGSITPVYRFSWGGVYYTIDGDTQDVTQMTATLSDPRLVEAWGVLRYDQEDHLDTLLNAYLGYDFAASSRRKLARNLKAMYTRGRENEADWRARLTLKQLLDAIRPVYRIGSVKNRRVFNTLIAILPIDDMSQVCMKCGAAECVDGTQASPAYSVGTPEFRTGFCSTCAEHCVECEGALRLDQRVTSGSTGAHCESCSDYCSHHDLRYVDVSCPECLETPRRDRYSSNGNDGSVRGYGHTTPKRWLHHNGESFEKPRDPDDKQPYYLGVELEIGTQRYSARTLLEWARDNAYRGFVDAKADSSVSGYEIATGTMTPQAFEALDWDGFFDVLRATHGDKHDQRAKDGESSRHGLHVHVSRSAFNGSDVALAAFAYMITLDGSKHLERVARRSPYSYCNRVESPVSGVLSDLYRASNGGYSGTRITDKSRKFLRQGQRAYAGGKSFGRDAVNLGNEHTVEIRAFKSTRRAEDFRNSVRFVYMMVDYIRFLQSRKMLANRAALKYDAFLKWVEEFYPHAFEAFKPPTPARRKKKAAVVEPVVTANYPTSWAGDAIANAVDMSFEYIETADYPF
jgi:hypothetical protein